jgi:hypothetical protein
MVVIVVMVIIVVVIGHRIADGRAAHSANHSAYWATDHRSANSASHASSHRAA